METLNDTPFENEAIPCMGPEGKTVYLCDARQVFTLSDFVFSRPPGIPGTTVHQTHFFTSLAPIAE